MSSIEYELFTKWQRIYLKKCLQNIKDSGVYDYILIDAPPTLGGWVMNILCASDQVVVPWEASPWGMFGLANMFDFLNEVKQIAPELKVANCSYKKWIPVKTILNRQWKLYTSWKKFMCLIPLSGWTVL